MFRQGRSLVGTLCIPVICVVICSMLMKYLPTAFTFLSLSSQGWCLVSEGGRIALQISLSERGERPTHLDKLKPYVLENIVVLLVLPSPDAVCMSICSFILSIISIFIFHFALLDSKPIFVVCRFLTQIVLVIFKGALFVSVSLALFLAFVYFSEWYLTLLFTPISIFLSFVMILILNMPIKWKLLDCVQTHLRCPWAFSGVATVSIVFSCSPCEVCKILLLFHSHSFVFTAESHLWVCGALGDHKNVRFKKI